MQRLDEAQDYLNDPDLPEKTAAAGRAAAPDSKQLQEGLNDDLMEMGARYPLRRLTKPLEEPEATNLELRGGLDALTNTVARMSEALLREEPKPSWWRRRMDALSEKTEDTILTAVIGGGGTLVLQWFARHLPELQRLAQHLPEYFSFLTALLRAYFGL